MGHCCMRPFFFMTFYVFEISIKPPLLNADFVYAALTMLIVRGEIFAVVSLDPFILLAFHLLPDKEHTIVKAKVISMITSLNSNEGPVGQTGAILNAKNVVVNSER